MKIEKIIFLFLCPVVYKYFQADNVMYEFTLHHYQLQMNLIWDQDTPNNHKRFILENLNDICILCSYASYRSR